MKWFTHAWAVTDGAAHDRTIAEYSQHLRALASEAPESLKSLLLQTDPRLRLDDARIETASDDRDRERVALTLVQGDLSVGYGLLVLSFEGARQDGLVGQPFTNRAEPIAREIWYFEFDRAEGGRLAIRALTWPLGEFAVEFRSVSWTWRPRPDRTIGGNALALE